MRSEGQVSHSVQVLLFIYIADSITKESSLFGGTEQATPTEMKNGSVFFDANEKS
jgi:hypothetical protein